MPSKKHDPLEKKVEELEKLVQHATVSAKDIDTLKRLTEERTLQIESGDLVERIQNDAFSLEAINRKPGNYYHDLIFALVHIRLPEEEARRDWTEILKHKFTVSETLGRNIGVHVATLDYYTNVKKRVNNPTIIDASDYAETAHQAITDRLTHAYNRQFFNQELDRLYVAGVKHKRPFCLVLLDLDHFKLYNDLNGHIKGDIALMETVRILHAVCSPEDTVFRYGGEEFAILLPNQKLDAGIRTAANVRQALFDYRFINEHLLPGNRLSVSLGITTFRNDTESPQQMVEEADQVLYEAKNDGRNKVKIFLKEKEDESSDMH